MKLFISKLALKTIEQNEISISRYGKFTACGLLHYKRFVPKILAEQTTVLLSMLS